MNNPTEGMKLELETGTNIENDCSSFHVDKIKTYYKSNGELGQVFAYDTNGRKCYSILEGKDRCESKSASGMQSHEYTFNKTHPWVGFHGHRKT